MANNLDTVMTRDEAIEVFDNHILPLVTQLHEQDGDFDELDIVYAFTVGHYVVDGGPATSALAAAIDAAHADNDGL